MSLLRSIKREYTTIKTLKGLLNWTKGLESDATIIVADDIEATIDKYASNVAIRFEGGLTTFEELDARANKVANWALGKGLKAGDAVALFMENRPEYISIWFGLSKIGVISGLINHNLSDKTLAHCINVANAKMVITGAEQDQAMASVDGQLEGAPKVWTLGGETLGGETGGDLKTELIAVSDKRPDRSHRAHLRGGDVCMYVYTSGTTGMPKAAKLTQSRLRGMMRTFIAPCGFSARDRIYVTLPLYHSTGGVCAVGMALMTGGSMVLRRKFSASQFWDDVADQGVTVITYIGELCRYLLNQPVHPKETAHKIKAGFGNGLRPDIWQQFVDRFHVPKLVEFYGSTEGNVSFVNVDGTIGAVGRMPSYLKNTFAHVAFVKFDVAEEAPVRNAAGFCMPADLNEPGEALGKMGDEAATRFEGYNNAASTEKKILRDVFETGDAWFRTGDLMKKDALGYIYFVDRIGDTFRWKGENVSTNEVAEIASNAPGIATANVYGVSVPGTDGRAGMAAITTLGDVDYDGLHAWFAERLPKYAIPLFIRVQKEAETTGTFKYRKVDLVKEGFDPHAVSEPIWYFDPESGKYEPLTPDAYETLKSGAVRF